MPNANIAPEWLKPLAKRLKVTPQVLCDDGQQGQRRRTYRWHPAGSDDAYQGVGVWEIDDSVEVWAFNGASRSDQQAGAHLRLKQDPNEEQVLCLLRQVGVLPL